MSCFWRHKWSHWSEPKEELWTRTIGRADKIIKTYEFTKNTQTRTCEKCGKVDWREI
jgi:hypothetical protein